MKKFSISIDFKSQSDRSVLLEVALRNEPIFTGRWTFDIRLGRKALLPDGKWMTVCEHVENGCDYTESELRLTNDYRLQRSLLVNHNDKVLLLADAIIASDDCKTKASLTYHADVCVSPKLRGKTSAEATEILFRPIGRAGTSVFRVLPLALPEWKPTQSTTDRPEGEGSNRVRPEGEDSSTVQPTGLVGGTLTEAESILTLRQESTGRSLFAPLFFDLDAKRLSKRYTWRQLTVGENMKRVPEDRAVGYRIQLDKAQFLLYRSLTQQASRTVLGHNLVDNFCFARFDAETGVEPLIALSDCE